jgi:hypothetical protein
MSARGQKPKGAPDAASPAHTVPLSDVTITMDRRGNFGSGKDHQAITVTGRQLGQVLAWIAQTRPGCIGGPDSPDPAADNLWPSDDIALKLEGLGELLRGLSTADLESMSVDVPSVFALLGESISDLSARLGASEDGTNQIKRATLNLPAQKAVA